MLYEKVMRNIRDYTYDELKEKIIDIGEKKYRADQIFSWLHKNMISDLSATSNLSKDLLKKINENFDTSYPIIEKEYISKLDDTKKYLIRLDDNNLIESVLMKYKYGYTVCVSSEVGCDMGCRFCASTIGGLKRNLYTYEILAQIYLISKKNNLKISNIVIMGSGEPLLNFENVIRFIKIINCEQGQNISMRNITLSTCGIVNNIYKLAEYGFPITLALSLHAPNDSIRNEIMPSSRNYQLSDVLKAMADYFIKTSRRITFEYALIKDINDGEINAKKLINLFKTSFAGKHIDYNVNLIPVNEIKENNFKAPDRMDVERFKDILIEAGVQTTIRRELGKDISGSCGQLRASVK